MAITARSQQAATKPKGPAAAAAATASTARPDIKELVKGGTFTNSAGMVMVKISPSLWAGKYLVTQQDYQNVAGSNPSQFHGDLKPVDSEGWK